MDVQLDQHELDILLSAKVANPFWFDAILKAAAIMADRRKKYSGDHHPYWNFVDLTFRTGRTVVSTLLFYLNIKISRLSVSMDDFVDESMADSLVDAVNYSALALGWVLGNLTSEKILEFETIMGRTPPQMGYDEEVDWPTVCVDLDGVLNEYTGEWKGYFQNYPVSESAKELLRGIKDRGYFIHILTARTDISRVWTWLEENNLSEYITRVSNVKPPAVLYIDDRAMRYNGDIIPVLASIDNGEITPHWKKE